MPEIPAQNTARSKMGGCPAVHGAIKCPVRANRPAPEAIRVRWFPGAGYDGISSAAGQHRER